jgi:hypothetical protein
MSAKITVALLLLALVVGCEPEPMLDPAVELKPASAGEAVSGEGSLHAGEAGEKGDDGTAAESPVIERLRANAEALCARKSKRSSQTRSWFACDRASTGTQACRTAQVEAGREWYSSRRFRRSVQRLPSAAFAMRQVRALRPSASCRRRRTG